VRPDYSWSLEPGTLVGLAVALGLYAWRWRDTRAEGGARAASVWRLAAFAGGIVAILAAIVSPIDRLSEQLLVMHMVQHLLLIDVAPILLILGLTKALARPATRRVMRLEQAAGPLAHPVFAVVFYVAVVVLWHLPALYDGALRHPAIHVLEHVLFMSAGLLYWWHLISPIRSRHRLGGLGPVGYMIGGKFGLGILGIGLTFSSTLLYDFYAHRGTIWGLSPIDDQNVAGALMALEQTVVMGTVLAFLFVRALAESEREDQRTERYGSA
jgi:cytochrome c oxidase assembly factor CtaG